MPDGQQGSKPLGLFRQVFEQTFPDARTAGHEYIEGGEGVVIVGFRVIGSGRSSGAGTEMELWQVWRVSDQLVPGEVAEFTTREDALDAARAGSSSQPGAG